MNIKKHLFVGFGDIARRCTKHLQSQGGVVVGVSRSIREDMCGVEHICADASQPEIFSYLRDHQFDSVVITLSPDEYSEAGYRRTYYDTCLNLIRVWEQRPKLAPKRILFISSSSVYGQDQGEWVDEESLASPQSAAAQVLRETENLFFESKLNTCVVRFSGIYGPGRDYLIRQVLAGKGGNGCYTNRIHIDDCVGVLCYLLEQADIQRLYLASDSSPVKSHEIREWLAERLGVSEKLSVDTKSSARSGASSRGGNKRCSNLRIRQLGYQFKYPNYQQGYLQALSAYCASE